MGMAKSTFQRCSDEDDFLHTPLAPVTPVRALLLLV